MDDQVLGDLGICVQTAPQMHRPESIPKLEIGSILKDRFILEEVIGEGGMGAVYKALDTRKQEMRDSDPYVALKILSDDFKKHPNAVVALQRETRKAQRVSHPNIVPVYDFDRDDNIVFMTMEYLQGITLDQLIKNPLAYPLSTSAIYKIIFDIADALHCAHEKGIIHSDIKPKNIIWTHDHEIKIIDFGIARALKYKHLKFDDVNILNSKELAAHTPAYASYEMLTGEDPQQIDDLYGLACITYELLAHRHPYAKASAKQALEEGKVPDRIPGLDKQHWLHLKKALTIKSSEKIMTAKAFAEGFQSGNKAWKVMLYSAVGILATLGLTSIILLLSHVLQIA